MSGVAVALGMVLFLGGFVWGAVVYRPYTVPTDSMAPTIGAGDRILAERVDGTDVRRGDVVV
ncbi:S26 family signal peptidase, partial [Streptomyces sp. TRM76130]|nr:S26 family signal peptidase [Streptomyces sp. TRM76130]